MSYKGAHLPRQMMGREGNGNSEERKMSIYIKSLCAAVTLLPFVCASSASGDDAGLLSDKASYPLLKYDYVPSPDGRDFTLYYGDAVAEASACNVKPAPGKTKPVPGHTGPVDRTNPVVSQVSTVILPLRSAGPVRRPFFVQGYAKTGAGGHATLLISVNGQTKIIEFPAKTDLSFVETLDYSSPSVAELRVTFVLLAECDAYLSGGVGCSFAGYLLRCAVSLR